MFLSCDYKGQVLYLELDLPVLNGNQHVTESMYMSLGLLYFEFRVYSTTVITDVVATIPIRVQTSSFSSVLQKATVVNCCGRER